MWLWRFLKHVNSIKQEWKYWSAGLIAFVDFPKLKLSFCLFFLASSSGNLFWLAQSFYRQCFHSFSLFSSQLLTQPPTIFEKTKDLKLSSTVSQRIFIVQLNNKDKMKSVGSVSYDNLLSTNWKGKKKNWSIISHVVSKTCWSVVTWPGDKEWYRMHRTYVGVGHLMWDKFVWTWTHRLK